MNSHPDRPTNRARPFGIADGLILVAALAAGMAAGRGTDPITYSRVLWGQLASELFEQPSFGLFVEAFYEIGSVLVVPGVSALTLACLLMRVRGPRPDRGRLSRQPGFMACLAAAPVIALAVVVVLAVRALTDPDGPHLMQRVLEAISFGSIQAGAAVVWCWATLAVGGRWAAEPTWVDRLGRVLGGAWILLAVFYGSVIAWIWLS